MDIWAGILFGDDHQFQEISPTFRRLNVGIFTPSSGHRRIFIQGNQLPPVGKLHFRRQRIRYVDIDLPTLHTVYDGAAADGGDDFDEEGAAVYLQIYPITLPTTAIWKICVLQIQEGVCVKTMRLPSDVRGI